MVGVSSRLFILVVTVASLFFQPTLSFVLPKATVVDAINLQIDDSTEVNDDGEEAVYQISNECDSLDWFHSPIDRRQGLARMSLAAPLLWVFPEMACTSSTTKQTSEPKAG